ncbi:hypothetical protein [Alteromonas ponticola]|uniref:ApeI dehydratase-like domain-containing protein n=1 Tax=Alteromonas ponticola TaxID=2720613 RepID=A0ABX1R2I1_9ALTE|nr:hypothetical protein [Alteromonas ponticola]NMH60664.1 hypothetical protein [Alteromonas ponticola]
MIDQETLNGLFNKYEGPTVTACNRHDDAVVINLYVDDNLRWFQGHFPEQPVLPGIVQIDWAGTLARALMVGDNSFKQLINIKFKTMVMPNTAMQLELTYQADKGSLKFHFFNENTSFSQGSFKFIPL